MSHGVENLTFVQEADYVIIGSGSAGSVAASRLSEDGKHTVLVLEYGGTDIGPFIQMPAALSYPMNMARYDWGYGTEPEPKCRSRTFSMTSLRRLSSLSVKSTLASSI